MCSRIVKIEFYLIDYWWIDRLLIDYQCFTKLSHIWLTHENCILSTISKNRYTIPFCPIDLWKGKKVLVFASREPLSHGGAADRISSCRCDICHFGGYKIKCNYCMIGVTAKYNQQSWYHNHTTQHFDPGLFFGCALATNSHPLAKYPNSSTLGARGGTHMLRHTGMCRPNGLLFPNP